MGPWPGGGLPDVLGSDPAPGDAGRVRAAAGVARRCAAVVEEQAGRLAPVDVAAWHGAAATASAAWLTALAVDVRGGAAALARVAGALDAYADALAAAQARAHALRVRAEEAACRAQRARAEVAGASGAAPWGTPDGRFPEVLRAVAERDAAEAEVAALRREAQRVAEELVDAGRLAARVVLEACEGLSAPRALGTAAGAVAGPVAASVAPPGCGPAPQPGSGGGEGRGRREGLADEMGAFVREHAEALETVADTVAVVGTVAAVAAVLLPPGALVLGLAGGVVAVTGAVGAAGAVATGATVVGAAAKGALVAGTEKEITWLWSDALALGTLGASRLLAAPVRFAPRLAPYTISGSRAVSLGRPVTTRPHHLPSIWDHGATMGSRELVVRSVDFAVQAPAGVVAAVGAGQAGRSLRQRHGPGSPAARPEPRRRDRRPQPG